MPVAGNEMSVQRHNAPSRGLLFCRERPGKKICLGPLVEAQLPHPFPDGPRAIFRHQVAHIVPDDLGEKAPTQNVQHLFGRHLSTQLFGVEEEEQDVPVRRHSGPDPPPTGQQSGQKGPTHAPHVDAGDGLFCRGDVRAEEIVHSRLRQRIHDRLGARLEQPGDESELTRRVGQVGGVVEGVAIEVVVAGVKAQRVHTEKTAQSRAVHPRAVVVVAALGIEPPTGEEVGVADGRGGERDAAAIKDADLAVDVVLVPLDQCAAGVGDLGDGAERVAVVVVGLATALHRQRLVHPAAVGVAGQESTVGGALLQHAVLGVVDVMGAVQLSMFG